MKKTFSLNVLGHQPPRVVAAIKNDVRKYLKRERRKALPEGVDYWQFNCKVGFGAGAPEPKLAKDLIAAIDSASAQDCGAVYIEILAAPGHRMEKEQSSEIVNLPDDQEG